MKDFSQGDIIRIEGFKKQLFIIVSKNAFIKAMGVFHVCPIIANIPDGPIHIKVQGKKGENGTVICEQVKVIDPIARSCNRVDSLAYEDIMNISDAVQGMFEYD